MSQTTAFDRPSISHSQDTPELAATYEEKSGYQFEHGKVLIAALGLKRGDAVLDIGSGTGRLAGHVAEIVGPRGKVVGIDPLPLRVEIANAKNIANFEAHVGRAEDLSQFADESFDAVYLNSVFHWVEDKPRALAEIKRALKPAGRLGLNSADPKKRHESAVLSREALEDLGVDSAHGVAAPILAVDPDELRALLAAAGFGEIEAVEHVFVDLHEDVDGLIAWSNSSSFGNNAIVRLSDEDRARWRAAFAEKLEAKRTPDGYRLERYLTFATATKPA
ncbi:MAG: methyltransferase [Methylocystaceae bacterium]|nr:MAG: methyltransferase [Methylocystaceae bacterium]